MKVALTVPVLPSVTVTSLTETGGGTSGQDWSLSRTETVVAGIVGRGDVGPAVAVEVAGRQPRIRARAAAKVSTVEKVPSPWPRRTLTPSPRRRSPWRVSSLPSPVEVPQHDGSGAPPPVS